MELSPDQQLIHSRPGGKRGEVGDPAVRTLHAVCDRLLAESIEAVALDPQVRIRGADAAACRLRPADRLFG